MSMELVPFEGGQIEALLHEGQPFVVVKRVCENLGIDHDSQRQKLSSQPWAVTVIITATGPDGKQYKMFCCNLDTLLMWLAGISSSKVKAAARPALIAYQKEAARVLRDHFFGQKKVVDASLLAAAQQEIAAQQEEIKRLRGNVKVPKVRPTDIIQAWARAYIVEGPGPVPMGQIHFFYCQWALKNGLHPSTAQTVRTALCKLGFRYEQFPVVSFYVLSRHPALPVKWPEGMELTGPVPLPSELRAQSPQPTPVQKPKPAPAPKQEQEQELDMNGRLARLEAAVKALTSKGVH